MVVNHKYQAKSKPLNPSVMRSIQRALVWTGKVEVEFLKNSLK